MEVAVGELPEVFTTVGLGGGHILSQDVNWIVVRKLCERDEVLRRSAGQ